MNVKTSRKIVAICLAVIVLAGSITLGVKSDNGKITVREVVLSPYGADLSITMYTPDEVFKTNDDGSFVKKHPAVIVNAGFTDDRSALDNVVTELTRCGFVVASFDMYGHAQSESLNNKGFGYMPDPFTGDNTLLGADDVLTYLRTLDYVDQYNIGMVGHSLGGAATAQLLAKSAGYFTLEDTLLNMLHDEFGMDITAEDVAAQSPDNVAAALSEADLAVYNVRKAEVSDAYARELRAGMILDAGMNGVEPKVVEVAGHEVWRDAQANIGICSNISGGTTAGIKNKDFALTSALTLGLLSRNESAERDTWYSLNLSDTVDKLESTKICSFFDSAATPAIQDCVKVHSLRVLSQPSGWHQLTTLSDKTATAAVQFFTTTLQYNNGYIADGEGNVTAESTGTWKIEAIASCIAAFALIVMILPLANVIMDRPFFASLNGVPGKPVQSKKSAFFWICSVILVILPVTTYTKGVGWAKDFAPSPFSTIQLATQTAFWSVIITAVMLVLIVIKYFAYDKNKLGVSFCELYGLKISAKNLGKAIILALIEFVLVAIILKVYYEFFGYAEMRYTLLGSFRFNALTKEQFYNWFIYLIYFLPFYLFNSMVVASSRMKDMDEKKNMMIVAFINGSGMLILAVIQIIFGLYMKSATVIKTVPGSSASIYNLPFFAIMLFVTAITNWKMYKKTGSVIPGALENASIFTIPAIQAYMYFAF